MQLEMLSAQTTHMLICGAIDVQEASLEVNVTVR